MEGSKIGSIQQKSLDGSKRGSMALKSQGGDSMVLESAPKSKSEKRSMADKSDPGVLAKLKKDEDERESNEEPDFLKGLGFRKNRVKNVVNPDDDDEEQAENMLNKIGDAVKRGTKKLRRKKIEERGSIV
jgi:hypothetical protein